MAGDAGDHWLSSTWRFSCPVVWYPGPNWAFQNELTLGW